MFVGVLRLTIHVPGSRSLKDRRHVVRSFKDRLHSKLRLSVAEVGALEMHQKAIIGVAAVARESSRVEELLQAAASLAENLRDGIVLESRREIIAFGTEGGSVGVMDEEQGWSR